MRVGPSARTCCPTRRPRITTDRTRIFSSLTQSNYRMNDPLRITYIGGPTQLLEFGGVRLLTDPTFDDAGGEYPSGPATLRKLAGPAITLDQLGSFDYVLLTHDHHWDNLDHLGRQSLEKAKATLTTDEGASRLGGNSVAIKNWESCDFPANNGRTLRVIGTPARHGPAGLERGAVPGSFSSSPVLLTSQSISPGIRFGTTVLRKLLAVFLFRWRCSISALRVFLKWAHFI